MGNPLLNQPTSAKTTSIAYSPTVPPSIKRTPIIKIDIHAEIVA